jgi:AcrR family transcriptional regulator
MAEQSGSRTKQRTRLDRERVLRTAVAIADEDGIDSLTMRKLARNLDVEAMSLYYHVSDKDDILDGMVDLVVGEIGLPAKDDNWKAAMRRRGISAHETLSRHPWASSLMDSRANPGPAALRYYDSVIGCLREAGFSIAMAAHAFSAMDAYIYGFGLQELALPFEGEHDVGDVAAAILEQLPADESPYLVEMIIDHALQPGYNYASEFEFGLDLILDGLETARDTA